MEPGSFSPGRILLFAGLAMVVLGAVWLVVERFGIPFIGRLPGDIRWKGENGSFYFPITTCILVSVLGTVLLNWLFRR